jgi:hypothetical protein
MEASFFKATLIRGHGEKFNTHQILITISRFSNYHRPIVIGEKFGILMVYDMPPACILICCLRVNHLERSCVVFELGINETNHKSYCITLMDFSV